MTRSYEVVCNADDREQWLAARAGIAATASDIGTVLGLNKYKTRQTLLEEKAGLREPEDLRRNQNVWWGTQLEGPILSGAVRWHREGGSWWGARHCNVLLRSRKSPDIGCTLDGFVRTPKLGFCLAEVKKPTFFSRKNWLGGPPPQYAAQCQCAMYVTGIKRALLIGLVGGCELHVHVIDADPAFQTRMVSEAERFAADVHSLRSFR